MAFETKAEVSPIDAESNIVCDNVGGIVAGGRAPGELLDCFHIYGSGHFPITVLSTLREHPFHHVVCCHICCRLDEESGPFLFPAECIYSTEAFVGTRLALTQARQGELPELYLLLIELRRTLMFRREKIHETGVV